MTNWKKHLSPLLFFTFSLTGFWFLSGQITPGNNSKLQMKPNLGSSEKANKEASRLPGSVPQTPRNPVVDNTITGQSSLAWKKQLEKTLLIQSAGQMKSATIEKVDSFKWKIGQVEVPVDSIIVKLEHVKGHRSSFRAIVDSTNGKILETWDHPLLDDFEKNHSAGIKIDPRYHND